LNVIDTDNAAGLAGSAAASAAASAGSAGASVNGHNLNDNSALSHDQSTVIQFVACIGCRQHLTTVTDNRKQPRLLQVQAQRLQPYRQPRVASTNFLRLLIVEKQLFNLAQLGFNSFLNFHDWS
jgi:hypothetical protein